MSFDKRKLAGFSLMLGLASRMEASAKPRRYDRIGLPKGLLVVWQGTGNRIVSRVATLSLGGLFIEVPDPAPSGELLKLFFKVPGGEVRARAMVRDSHPGKGMGVEFTAMGPEDRARLHQLLSKLLGVIGKA
jgi:hypothetical protein